MAEDIPLENVPDAGLPARPEERAVLRSKLIECLFTVSRALFYLFTLRFWVAIPASGQFLVSRCLGWMAGLSLSRLIIGSYISWNYDGRFNHSRFRPASGAPDYQSFQDFFVRKLASPIVNPAAVLWPCDGLVCDQLSIEHPDRIVTVKKQRLELRRVFDPFGAAIPAHYEFTNIFLHNRDYHRIHAPVSGTVTAIERVAGELRLLRPWAYRDNPSRPAFTNERLNIRMSVSGSPDWFLSVVGGPGVSTITPNDRLAVGTFIEAGEELCHFELGSTLCLATPVKLGTKRGERVAAGQTIALR